MQTSCTDLMALLLMAQSREKCVEHNPNAPHDFSSWNLVSPPPLETTECSITCKNQCSQNAMIMIKKL